MNDTDQDKVDGGPSAIVFTCRLECPSCGAEDEYSFSDGSQDYESITDMPVQLQRCSACGHEWEAECEGWIPANGA